MGRELRRKQAKKEGKSLQKEELVESNQIKKYVRITLVIIFIICLIYILSALFVTKELRWFGLNEPKTEENTNKVDNSIIAGSVFMQSEETYYVYFYDFNGEIDEDITSKISSISDKVYKVDTSSDLNSKYVKDAGNKNAKKLEELQVISPTVIKFVNNEIKEYFEGKEILNIK